MQRLTATLVVRSQIRAVRLLILAALAQLLPCALAVPTAAAESFWVTVAQGGSAAGLDCRLQHVRAGRPAAHLPVLPPESTARSALRTGRAVYTITLTRRGRPRPGFSCVRAVPRGLRRLRLGERFRSGPFVCRHLSVPSLDPRFRGRG